MQTTYILDSENDQTMLNLFKYSEDMYQSLLQIQETVDMYKGNEDPDGDDFLALMDDLHEMLRESGVNDITYKVNDL